MKSIPDKSIDLVLTDPPYWTTQCSRDEIVPFDLMRDEIKRIIVDKWAIIMTASQPFTSKLIMSNVNDFKYCWVWDKWLSWNIFLAETQPMKIHEDICVFSKSKHDYYPIMVSGVKRKMKNNGMNDSAFWTFGWYEWEENNERNPKTILYFPNTDRKNIQHPTQKPVDLFKYLIQTYTKDWNTILDPFLWSWTTAIACKEMWRNFIGIEKEQKYVDIANKRLQNTTIWMF